MILPWRSKNVLKPIGWTDAGVGFLEPHRLVEAHGRPAHSVDEVPPPLFEFDGSTLGYQHTGWAQCFVWASTYVDTLRPIAFFQPVPSAALNLVDDLVE